MSVAGCSVLATADSNFAASRAAVSSAFGDFAPAALGPVFLYISSSAALSRSSSRETISKVVSTTASSGLPVPGNFARGPVSEIALLFSAGFAVPSGAAEVAAEAACVVPAISAGLAVPDAAEVAVAGFVEPEPETALSFLDNKQRRSGF